jgi:acyl dehydratase
MNITSVGQKFSLKFQFSQDDVNQFIQITGDDNPIHHDAEYAKNTMFKRPIVHGFLGGAMFSRIFGSLFPGEGTIYLSQNLKFRAPMYVEQEYVAQVEITTLDADRHSCTVATQILDDKGKAVTVGEAIIMNKNKIGTSD